MQMAPCGVVRTPHFSVVDHSSDSENRADVERSIVALERLNQ
jgi:hypothetical protein